MKPPYITDQFLQKFITEALNEDVGDGDHSSLSAISEDAISRARLLVKDNGVLAGMELAEKIFEQVDPRLKVNVLLKDGSSIKFGDIALTVEGPARSILTAERLVLNCMQRMSAIATKAAHLKKLIAGTKAAILDTRKTTPNFRLLEKWGVVIGGGRNHRIGLYDMIMLKDNHIDMAGGIEQAIIRAKDYLRATNRQLAIEVETRNLKEVSEVLTIGGVDVVMLDNMSVEQMKEAVTMIGGKFKTEASGGITEETIRSIAECGVDFISVGALTHSIKSLDLSLKAF
ncbi:carboxylating nicotinate-nucleotide diphosphorylase [Pseudochryseolinea flava]|uniref:Probable nicotinate-nucleotide pyrophosphorylase [carboxylating] n=1 Tax=Pseudochryseolinea flava TaxID=2059302 RepID=A0A364Y7H3_9BACT|nr:carboxylating nicotinate-nucleotide diphosphorylase [Pseudochryseolinea flava]RAW03064.1 carboxylating nicotinate-nucleotide diphosphorylase [Pseudochryseolinea flava]